MEYYTLTADEALSALHTTREGLTEREAQKRLARDGENVLTEEKRKNPVLLFLSQFKDLMTLLLLAAAGISAVLSFITRDGNDLVDTVILLVIILLNNVIGFIQQYRADNAIAQMKSAIRRQVKTLRDGKLRLIDSILLVRGDIIALEEGDAVPADCRILSAKGLCVNESALTGESADVEKSPEVSNGKKVLAERKNMLYASSYVVHGTATAVVAETGMRGEIGKIAGILKGTEKNSTPLENALEKLGKVITYAVVGIALFLFLFGIFFRKSDLLSNFMSSVAVAVAAIPEGMPAVVTILMAFGVQRMSKRRAVVRKLSAVETLGSCDCICSDKTGTLTQNKMTVRKVLDLSVDGELFCCMCYCNNAKGEGGKYVGDATETALLAYLEAEKVAVPKAERLDEIPFDSERKRMSVVMRTQGGDRLYMKGGAEIVRRRCRYVFENGQPREMTQSDREKIDHACNEMAKSGMRVLGFACDFSGGRTEDGLTFLGACGLTDPPKEGVKEAVQSCKEAGIGVRMITGDRKDTALAVARELGIADGMQSVMTGEELDETDEREQTRKILSATVFARVNPVHKAKIVRALQAEGKTVAMTGDGVNDSPAVKSADIGIAMGSGTDITKSVADIVVQGDDFPTIVSAVREGRHIFSNIRKTVAFFLSTNFGEVLVVLLVSLFFFRFGFLNSTQLLWINLITDTFPVLALGAEPEERDIMRRPPQKAEKELFSGRSVGFMSFVGLTLALCAFASFVCALTVYGNAVAITVAFFTMSFSEILSAFVVRSDLPFAGGKVFANRVLLITALFSFLLNILLCVSAPVRAAFNITSLTAGQWGLVVGFSLPVVPLGEGVKFLLRRRTGKNPSRG